MKSPKELKFGYISSKFTWQELLDDYRTLIELTDDENEEVMDKC